MRTASAAFVAVCLIAIGPSRAAAQTAVGGFGSMPVNSLSSLDGASFPVDFGGRVSIGLVPGVEVLGEFGRIGNVMPATLAIPLAFTPFDVRVSAFYGEGGVRLLAAPRSAFSPYVEGTAGFAHLGFHVSGLSGTADAVTRAALQAFDQREPIAGLGGGVLLGLGPMQVDLGYRYKKIFSDSVFGTILGAGQGLASHQVRFGVGVRF
jgi:hypothetical protein